MKIPLDKNSPLPIGTQVKEQIRLMIHSGLYRSGDKLPSIHQLAETFDVNKNTIVTVLKSLENEGIVESSKGKGIFVKNGKIGSGFDKKFLVRLELLVQEAKKRGIGLNELINLIGIKFSSSVPRRSVKALLIMGLSSQIVDFNVQKLKDTIPGVGFEGLFINKITDVEKIEEVADTYDFIIVPEIIFDLVRERIPEGKPVVRTSVNLRELKKLRKGMEKKSKIAVIGVTKNSAKALAGMFISAGYFRPRLALAIGDIEEFKKELKEIETYVVCLSARQALDTVKLKGKDVYFIYDYIDDESMDEIRSACKNLI